MVFTFVESGLNESEFKLFLAFYFLNKLFLNAERKPLIPKKLLVLILKPLLKAVLLGTYALLIHQSHTFTLRRLPKTTTAVTLSATVLYSTKAAVGKTPCLKKGKCYSFTSPHPNYAFLGV